MITDHFGESIEKNVLFTGLIYYFASVMHDLIFLLELEKLSLNVILL